MTKKDALAELDKLHYAHWRVLDALLHAQQIDARLLAPIDGALKDRIVTDLAVLQGGIEARMKLLSEIAGEEE